MLRGWLVLMLVLAIAPGAQGVPKCADVASDGPDVIGYYYAEDAGTSYQVWRETNGAEGLQRNICKTSDGDRVAADTKMVSIPTALALPNSP